MAKKSNNRELKTKIEEFLKVKKERDELLVNIFLFLLIIYLKKGYIDNKREII